MCGFYKNKILLIVSNKDYTYRTTLIEYLSAPKKTNHIRLFVESYKLAKILIAYLYLTFINFNLKIFLFC